MPKEMVDLVFTVTLPVGTPYHDTYTLHVGDCTGLDDLDIRRETGYSLVGLMEQLKDDQGLALVFVCAVAWLVRRRQYPHVTFQDIARSVPWGAEFDLDFEGEGADPLAEPASENVASES